MNLEKAIKVLKDIRKGKLTLFTSITTIYEAIDTVLKALDERYNKGYQDGFKQAKFDCEMDKLDGRKPDHFPDVGEMAGRHINK